MSDERRPGVAEVRVRRAPRFGVFAAVGGVLGVIAALVLASVLPASETAGVAATFGTFCLILIPAGLLLGALTALMLDAVSRRRARVVAAEHSRVDAADDAPESGGEPAAG